MQCSSIYCGMRMFRQHPADGTIWKPFSLGQLLRDSKFILSICTTVWS